MAKKIVKKATKVAKDLVITITIPRQEAKDAIKNGTANNLISQYTDEASEAIMKAIENTYKK